MASLGYSRVFNHGTRSSTICPPGLRSPLPRPPPLQPHWIPFVPQGQYAPSWPGLWTCYLLPCFLPLTWLLLFIFLASVRVSPSPLQNPSPLQGQSHLYLLNDSSTHPSDCQLHQGRGQSFTSIFLGQHMPQTISGIQQMCAEEIKSILSRQTQNVANYPLRHVT